MLSQKTELEEEAHDKTFKLTASYWWKMTTRKIDGC